MPEDNQPHAGIVTGTYQYDNATLVILRAAEAAEWTRMDQFIALSPPSSFSLISQFAILSRGRL